MLTSYTATTLASNPGLATEIGRLQQLAWAPFMLADSVGLRLWPALERRFAAFQFVLHDERGEAVGYGSSVPFAWDGSVAGLPAGWDDVLERAEADHGAGRAPNTLSALAAVVHPAVRGAGLGAEILLTMRQLAAKHDLGALVAPVRPSLKNRYPLTPIARYLGWTGADGLPFDPWLRTHVRLGARVLTVAQHSMRVVASVAAWEGWTGLRFPESGVYIVPEALTPIHIDRSRDEGVYVEPNVWMRHSPPHST